jgi:hypothetical protein
MNPRLGTTAHMLIDLLILLLGLYGGRAIERMNWKRKYDEARALLQKISDSYSGTSKLMDRVREWLGRQG